MLKSLVTALAVVVSTMAWTQEPTVPRLPVTPPPREVELMEGSFALDQPCMVVAAEPDMDLLPALQIARALKDIADTDTRAVRKTGWRDPRAIVLGGAASRRMFWERGIDTSPLIGSEGYALIVTPDGVAIRANTEAGLFYGAQTLVQLIQAYPQALPGLVIQDWPLMEVRAVSDDISRGQISTLENFKDIIRFLSFHKKNVYMPYIEDVFAFKSHPKIGRGRGRLTKREVAEMQGYAKRRHVQIIPVFEAFGHQPHLLALPEYNHLAEVPEKPWSFDPTNPETYELLDDLFAEVCEAFEAPYLCVGCDESWDIGKGRSALHVAEKGVAEVHRDHYLKIHALCQKYGKEMWMYGDMLLKHPEIMDGLPRDVAIVDWHYNPGVTYPYATFDGFRSRGFDVIASSSVKAWRRVFPHYNMAAATNIERCTRRGYEAGARGEIASSWGGGVNETFNLRENNLFGYAFSGACAWAPDTASYEAFKPAYFLQRYGTTDPDFITAFDTVSAIDNILRGHHHYLWKEPFAWEKPFPGMPPEHAEREAIELRGAMGVADAVFERVAPDVTRNVQDLDYFRFATCVADWIGAKLLAEIDIYSLEQGADPDDATISAGIASCEEAARLGKGIKKDFKRLWLRTNKKPELHYHMKRLDTQIDAFEAKAKELAQGR